MCTKDKNTTVVVESLELSPKCISHLALFVARELLNFAKQNKKMNVKLILLAFILSISPCASRIRGFKKYNEMANIEDTAGYKINRQLKGPKGDKKGKGGKGEYSPVASPAASPATSPAISPATSPVSAPNNYNPPVTGKGGKGKGVKGKGSLTKSPVSVPNNYAPPATGKGGKGKEKGRKWKGGKMKGDKGKGGKNGKSSKSKSNSKGKGGTVVVPPPVVTVEFQFVQLPPNATIPIFVDAPPSEVGTVFISNDPLLNVNLTVINSTFVTGVCTRTQAIVDLGNNNSLVGSGYCQFTYTITSMNSATTTAVTFNAVGEVVDIFGGTLAITGGTGELAGAYGELQIVPTYQQDTPVNADFFVDAVAYVGLATLFV